MVIQSTSALSSAAVVARSSSSLQNFGVSTAKSTDTLRISQAARDAPAASPSYVATNSDKSDEARLAEITAQGKPPEKLTADELDYVQKTTGFVNTFAKLSSAEKAPYEKAVTSGSTNAASLSI